MGLEGYDLFFPNYIQSKNIFPLLLRNKGEKNH